MVAIGAAPFRRDCLAGYDGGEAVAEPGARAWSPPLKTVFAFLAHPGRLPEHGSKGIGDRWAWDGSSLKNVARRQIYGVGESVVALCRMAWANWRWAVGRWTHKLASPRRYLDDRPTKRALSELGKDLQSTFSIGVIYGKDERRCE